MRALLSPWSPAVVDRLKDSSNAISSPLLRLAGVVRPATAITTTAKVTMTRMMMEMTALVTFYLDSECPGIQGSRG